MRRLGLRLEEFEEIFSLSGGPGGQHVNKVSTAVTLVHLPSGISLTVQDTRSQYRNRQLAVHRLMTLIDQKRKREMTERRAESERKRRQNSRRPRSLRREIRKSKERRAESERKRRQNSRRPRSLRREIRKSKERRAEIKQTRAKVSPE